MARAILHEAARASQVSREQRREWAARLLASVRPYAEAWRIVELSERGAGHTICVTGTRRSAKSETCGRVFTALAILHDGYVHRCVGRQLGPLARDIWEREGDRGAIGWLEAMGVPYTTNRQGGMLHTISFPWGSVIHLHAAETVHQVEMLRGARQDSLWFEEAQMLSLLAKLLGESAGATMLDRRATLVFTGTPGQELDGVLYARSQDPRTEQVRLSIWRNPYMPGETAADRWAHVVAHLSERLRQDYGITDEQVALMETATPGDLDQVLTGEIPTHLEPLLKTGSPHCLDDNARREYLGMWVASAEILVHPTAHINPSKIWWLRGANPHRVPVDESLTQIVHWRERITQLPLEAGSGRRRLAAYELLAGYDFGNYPDPAALWIGALGRDDGVIYELWSEKRLGLSDDQQFDWFATVMSEVMVWFAKSRKLVASILVVDADGGKRSAWSHRLAALPATRGLPLIGPYKADKLLQLREINLMLAGGQLRTVAGDPLDLEQRHLRWRPRTDERQLARDREIHKTRAVVLPDGTRCAVGSSVPPLGDHCLDARRYAIYTAYTLGRRSDG